jgi:hypothetical protein
MAYINTTQNRGNLYQKLHKLDVIGKMRYLLDGKGFRIRADGRWTRMPQDSVSVWDTPWIHQHQKPGQQCEIWHRLFFDRYKWVPTYCKDCWKVVVFIPTVKDLFNVYEIQHELGHPCKAGIEYRYTDERKYGAYFYNNGKQAGLDCYKMVREAIPENMDVILKCACSEYEIECGPPDEWKASPEQLEVEEMFKTWLVDSNMKHTQLEYMTAFTMLKWIHHAVHIGDLTYREFTNGEKLTVTMKTYHEEIENG